jgi:hypothetical protein
MGPTAAAVLSRRRDGDGTHLMSNSWDIGYYSFGLPSGNLSHSY